MSGRPERPTRADYVVWRQATTRWADDDAYGHMNNATYYELFDTAVNAHLFEATGINVRHLPTPFGGMKASGIGRDGGDYSFDFYMETKNIAVALGHHKIAKLGS